MKKKHVRVSGIYYTKPVGKLRVEVLGIGKKYRPRQLFKDFPQLNKPGVLLRFVGGTGAFKMYLHTFAASVQRCH